MLHVIDQCRCECSLMVFDVACHGQASLLVQLVGIECYAGSVWLLAQFSGVWKSMLLISVPVSSVCWCTRACNRSVFWLVSLLVFETACYWSVQVLLLYKSMLLINSSSGELRTQKLKSHLVRTEVKYSPFKAWSRSVYSHTCCAYCQGFLPCLFLPF